MGLVLSFMKYFLSFVKCLICFNVRHSWSSFFLTWFAICSFAFLVLIRPIFSGHFQRVQSLLSSAIIALNYCLSLFLFSSFFLLNSFFVISFKLKAVIRCKTVSHQKRKKGKENRCHDFREFWFTENKLSSNSLPLKLQP